MHVLGEMKPRIVLETLVEEKIASHAAARFKKQTGLRYIHRGYSEPPKNELDFLDRRIRIGKVALNELIVSHADTNNIVDGLPLVYKDEAFSDQERMAAKLFHAMYERAVMFGPDGLPEPLNLKLHFASGRQLSDRLKDVSELDRFIQPMRVHDLRTPSEAV